MPLHLYDVLRAVPTACGRRNGIDWPCGVLVVAMVRLGLGQAYEGSAQ